MTNNKNLPVLIYTMGRVSSGSCSIALQNAGYTNKFHVHTMNEEWRAFSGKASPADGMSPQEIERYEYDRKVRRDIIDAGKEALIISFVREPLTRNMSAFFINQIDRKDLVRDRTNEGLRRGFLKRYPHYVPLEWYKREFNSVLGINVFEHPFDNDRGHSVIESGRFRILLLRTEISNQEKGAALTEFLGEPVEMEVYKKVNKYELREEVNDLYREFKSEVKFQEDYLDYLYNSDYARHFMSGTEISELRTRWQSNDVIEVPWRRMPEAPSAS